MSKYRNKKTIVDNIEFSSKKEAGKFLELKDLEQKGHIKDLRLQVPFILQEGYTIDNKKIRPIIYVADFVYMENLNGDIPMWKEVVADVKASAKYQTEVYKLKKKIFEYKYNTRIKEFY